MKLVHESVVEGSEILEAVRAILLEPFEKEHLRPRIQLFEKPTQLRHGIATGRHTQDIVHQSLDKLLADIFAREKVVRNLA